MKWRHLLVPAGVAVALAVGVAGVAAATSTPTVLLPPTVTAVSTTITEQSPAKFKFQAQAGSIVPTSYSYQLNAGPPVQVTATNGRATVTVFPTSFTDQLSVVSLTADGRSDATVLTFEAAIPPPSADQDVTGDGAPDLIAVGGTAGLPSGLWQGTGKGSRGQVKTPALNIGTNGIFADNNPAEYDGAQVITGAFTGGSFQDFLIYFPGGNDAGGGAVLGGNNRGVVLSSLSGNETSISSGMFTDNFGDNPIQLVNGYDSTGGNFAEPDLMGISGDPTNGFDLTSYQSANGIGVYGLAVTLAVSTPTGGSDWQNWRLASKLLPSGMALLLWNPTTGALYLWEGVTVDQNTGAVSFTPYQLATSWLPGVALSTLQLTDVNADGVPDIWAVTPAGDVTAYIVSNLSATGPAKLKASPSQQLT
jgi:hypothetical protein